MKEETRRKLRIENLTRCMNCLAFSVCTEKGKENIVCCRHYREIGVESQVVAVPFIEWCKHASLDTKAIEEVVQELRELTGALDEELPPLSDKEMIKRIDKNADRLEKLQVKKLE
jgi:hypothetical protein